MCSLAEGRAPWGGQPVMPSAELGEHEAGVWALAADAAARLLVTGTEDGQVAALDARCRQAVWQVRCPSSFFQCASSEAHFSGRWDGLRV